MESHFATVWESVADVIPDAPAVVQGPTRHTWSAFEGRAARLAGALAAAGLGPGSKVGVFLYNSPEYLETEFAALKLRAVPINVNYRYVADELAYLLDNADAEALVFHTSLGDRVAEVLPLLPKLRLAIAVDDSGGAAAHAQVAGAERYEAVIEASAPAPRVTRRPDDVTMTYTGGTTGMPKGVVSKIGPVVDGLLVSVPNLLGMSAVHQPADVAAVARTLVDESRQYVSLPACPLMHATAMGIGTLPPLLFGSCVVLLNGRRFDVDELWAAVERERVTGITIVGDPFARPMLRGLEAGPPRDLGSVRFVLSSGAMFSVEIKAGLLDHLPDALILDFIASTEGAMGLSVSSRGAVAPTGTFRPGPGVVVLGDDDRVVQAGSGEEGVVAIAGGAEGYFKDPAKSAGTFRVVNGVRYTIPGDHALLAADGSIELLGRGSQCINTGGEKVFPEEVEEAIKAVPGIDDCLVFGVADDRFGNRVVGVASPSPDSSRDAVAVDAVLAEAGRHLAAYKLPRHLVLVDVVPRIASGKADYPAARRLFEDAAAVRADVEADRD